MSGEESWNDRQTREPVDVQGVVHLADGGDRRVLIENLSPGGCCIAGEYRIGDRVELTVPGRGRMPSQVRWAIGGRAGLRFLDGEDAD